MRTDSTVLSKESVEAVRGMIQADFGNEYLPEKAVIYGSAKRAQEAHEAIRPSDASLRPDDLKGVLSSEQFRLYDLIWRRFVACQMKPARWDNTSLMIAAPTPQGEAVFRATGRSRDGRSRRAD
jgi:DNA topoisomerase-1